MSRPTFGLVTSGRSADEPEKTHLELKRKPRVADAIDLTPASAPRNERTVEVLAITTSVAEIPGVMGAALYDDTGHCLSHRLVAPYRPPLLWEFLRELELATDFYIGAGMDDGVQAAVLVLEQGTILTRRAPGFELVALAGLTTNMAALGVALNVASLRLQQRVSSSSLSSTGSSSWRIAPPPPPPPAFESDGQDRTSTLRGHDLMEWSGARPLPGPPTAPANSPVPRAVLNGSEAANGSNHAMRQLFQTTQHYLGAHAYQILDEELHRLGATPQTLTPPQMEEIVRRVSLRVDAVHRHRYVSDLLAVERGAK